MCTLAVHWGWLDTVPGFPDRLRENPPRQGFFEHPEYLAVRAHLPAPWQDILDLAYYSGWRKQEILGLTWEEIDEAGGVIRLSPARSKTLVGRVLPISQPIAEAIARRRARRDPDSPLVFHRDALVHNSRSRSIIGVYPGFPTLFWGLSGFFVNDLMGKALWSSWKTRSVFQGAVGAFCASTAPSASTGPICMRQDRRVLGLQSTRE